MEKLFKGLSFKDIKKKNANVSLGKVVDNTTVCAFFIAIRLCGITLKKQ
ncbi:hypothetical protein T229_08860 [Tannerella sp. oral taxon BU063 isolate Cell 5]|uniref:Uncharacterized protein n=1 Tax=Tannerella sp. oral taxon BU063 isolate Cell 5 TaxID=1410950 RepID=W2CB12_9BACT|nr:hypothetical protein T229_08860 [Tannerella sp. oral taxon BU063 isolate Cell 5]